MKSLQRGCLAFCVAMSCLLAAAQPTLAQRRKPSVPEPPKHSDFEFQRDPRDRFADDQKPTGGTFNNTAAASNVASGFGTGMIVIGIGMLLVGLALTGGVVFMAVQGQKTSYAGSARRKRKKRRDDDDDD